MKHLTIIIHTNMQQDLADHLRTMEQVSGFTFSHAEGHGIQVENDPFLSARDKVVGYTPRVRADVLLEDTDVNAVLAMLRTATYGIAEHGVYWITAVEQSGRF